MAWYEEAVFYHIYPLGLTGAPQKNDYQEPVHRLKTLIPWIGHIKELGCSGLYIGPLFESVGHGYETTDYRRVDSRLGTNEDLREFVGLCHEAGIRVILDGVFNHTGRDFFAFRDILQNRESSRYLDWYCHVNFSGNTEYNDGFSYDNWGGFPLLAKLNLRNPQVRDYLLDTVRFWVSEFDIDGLRLDAADVLDFDFMRSLRALAEEIRPDFWLMGEVIHGEYSRWVNERTLHSVTNYHLHKALYSAHNDHNYFEIAHTVRRQMDMGIGNNGVRLYSFVDNHDVERIHTKLRNKAHFLPVHVLLYTLPGIPSVYYGSEFGIEGKKERFSDASLRPCLDLEDLRRTGGACLELITALGRIHQNEPALWYGDYRELYLTTAAYAFSRGDLLITVNNGTDRAVFDLQADGSYRGALSGRTADSRDGKLHLEIEGSGGEIWIPEGKERAVYQPVTGPMAGAAAGTDASADTDVPAGAGRRESQPVIPESAGQPLPKRAQTPKPYEEMSIEELQAEILAKMAANGPVTDRMKQDVLENIYPNSLLNWVKSFR
ncbi:MAG: alpha-amylase [Parasporobacterium sp.]|nr:alpha-amylase [Parasporobacterium sp.]